MKSVLLVAFYLLLALPFGGCSRILPSPEERETQIPDFEKDPPKPLETEGPTEKLPHSESGYYFDLSKPAKTEDERVFQSLILELAAESSDSQNLSSFRKSQNPIGIEIRMSVSDEGKSFQSKLERCEPVAYEEIIKRPLKVYIALQAMNGPLISLENTTTLDDLTEGKGLFFKDPKGIHSVAIKCSSPALDSGDNPILACNNLAMILSNRISSGENIHRAFLFKVNELFYMPLEDLNIKIASTPNVLKLTRPQDWKPIKPFHGICSINSILTPEISPQHYLNLARDKISHFKYKVDSSSLDEEDKSTLTGQLDKSLKIIRANYEENLQLFFENGHFKKSMVINLSSERILLLNQTYLQFSEEYLNEIDMAIQLLAEEYDLWKESDE